jgi:hypothetical protein
MTVHELFMLFHYILDMAINENSYFLFMSILIRHIGVVYNL